MKTILFYLTFLTAINTSIGQNLNFADSNAVWSVYNEKYFVDGDSTVNSIDYKKYYTSNDSIVTTGTLFALLRYDTLSGEVFAISADSTQEHLLYDFSLDINDTATVYPLSFNVYTGPIRIVVDQIDSLLLNGQYHKRLKILGLDQNTNLDEYWIEGIGSTFGPFNSGITGVVIFDIYYPILLCFERDGNVLFDNPDFPDCYESYPVGIQDNEFSSSAKLYPNPAKNFVIIEYTQKLKTYALFSISGNELERKEINANHISIDISRCSSGVYFIYLTDLSGNIIRKKIIVE